MKLKNIIQIGSFVVAGVAPMTSSTASASDYMCLACPAGTYSNGGSTSCTPCPAGTYSNAVATSCTKCPIGTYSSGNAGTCTQCPKNQSTDSTGAKCISTSDMTTWNFEMGVIGGKCANITLQPNVLYLVFVKGGYGVYIPRECTEDDDGNDVCNEAQDALQGGFVQYTFTVDSQTSAQICAGNNGNKTSGAAGSWIKIGDKYIVAGGAGAQASNAGGGGGAIGGGGSGAAISLSFSGRVYTSNGGSVGPYAGGAGVSTKGFNKVTCGNDGAGLNNEGGGKAGSSFKCDSGTNGRGQGGYVNEKYLFAGYTRSGMLGGEAVNNGLTSHDSNISFSNFACTSNRGCVALYTFRGQSSDNSYRYDNMADAK